MSASWLFLLLLTPLWLSGCGVSTHAPSHATPGRDSRMAGRPPTFAEQTVASQNEPLTMSNSNPASADLDRLAQLWIERTQKNPTVDYPVGAGDVLEVSVPAIEELNSRTVRVAGDGAITLPLIGLVQAAGLTEQQLVTELRHRLEANIMHDPQVHLFVREYRSRQVAVIGAVEKPGLYNLSGEAETILDLLSQAGGMKNDAATRINFVPAEAVESEQAKQLASLLPVKLGQGSHAPLLLKKTDPIVIDLQTLSKGGSQLYLTLPARPGDVIMVPGAGEVLIEGWVAKPGSYRVTPGLTVLGAVAAAGGSLFAADTGTVTVIRTSKEGEKIFLSVNLEKIKHGADADIPLQEGDVIDVASSPTKLVPYGFYRFFSTVFHVGASAPLF